MKINLIIKHLLVAVMAIVFAFNGQVSAQNDQHKTDTIYFPVFGCDSFMLAANNTVYYRDTVVEIAHRTADHGVVYISQLDIYQISIGKSYSVKDTVNAAVCPGVLPYAFRNNFYTMSGNYWIPGYTVTGCDSSMTLLQLKVFEPQNDTVYLTMCYNQTVVYYEDIPFNNPGIYYSPMGIDTNGCPMVQTFIVTQYPMQSDTVIAAVCENQLPYSYRGKKYNATGTYQVSYKDVHGCDAMDVLVLTVKPAPMARQNDTVNICAVDLPYIYNGQSYSKAGSYDIFLYNSYGCDSLWISLELQVTQPEVNEVTVSICPEAFPYTYDSVHVFAAPGKYYIDGDPDSLCHQYTLLTLEAYPVVNDTVVVCTPDSSYTYGDSTFTVSTIYTQVDTSLNGCLEYHTLHLTLNHQLVYDTVVASVCKSAVPYVFNGEKYYTTGKYDQIYPNRQGCDSLVLTLDLTVEPNVVISVAPIITRNDLPYIFHDSAFTASGNYSIKMPAATADECDTFYVLYLTVMPVYNTVLDTTVCANQPVFFLGDSITTAGAHQFIYHFADFDSIITLNVHHNPVYRDETVFAVVGEYELPYLFADTAYNEAGYYERTLSTVLGCDSVVSLSLTVNPAVHNNDTILREACSHDLPVLLFDSLLSEAGTYRYIVRTADGLYDSVFYVKLTVKESPTLVLADTAYMCTGNTVTLTAQSTGSVYLWNNGETQASVTVSLPGAYSVTVSNAFECTMQDTVQVIQVDLPNAQIEGGNTVCEGSGLLLHATGGATYLWGDGSTSDSITVFPTENTTYFVTVTNVYGCSQSKNHLVEVNPLPVITILGSSDICAGEYVQLIASGANSYRWNNGAISDRITVNTQGIYTVTGTDVNGCKGTSSLPLTVHALPVIKINGRPSICQGGNALLTATGASTYEWESGESTSSITPNLAGIYTVVGTDQYGCFASKSITVTNSQVNANITGNPRFCHGQSTTLTVVGDPGNTYRWFNGSSSNDVIVTTQGQYSVTVTNTMGCQNTLTIQVSEYSVTTPTISGNLTICSNQTTTLHASSGYSYRWDNGATQPLIVVNTMGTYTVTVTDQNGCEASTSASVIVNPIPTVSILAQDNICQGESVVMTATTSANNITWSTGQNTAAITVSPTQSTNYTVSVTDEHFCTNSASKQVTVKTLPSAYVSGPSSICQGDTATFEASGGISYYWSTGQYTRVIKTTTGGNYSVEVYGDNGCSKVLHKTLTVNSLPMATVTESAEICRGQQATLTTDAPVGSVFQWSTGSHQSQISVSESGTYMVTITNSNQCSRVYSAVVTVHELPDLAINGNKEICQGQSTTLVASGSPASQYVWSTNDHNASITVNNAGSYSVTATNSYQCSASASCTVIVHELPVVQIGGVTTICRGNSTTLTATGGSTYLWSTGDNSSMTVVSPINNHTYVVTVTDIYGCVVNAATTVTVNALPEITFTGNQTFCAGNSTTITASGASNYNWSTGSQSSSVVLNNSGTYYVTATNAQNCTSRDSIFVKMNPNPEVSITGTDLVCAGNTATLTASGAENYAWATGEIASTITVLPSATTTYSVTGYDSNGCFVTASKTVTVENQPSVQILGNRTVCQGQSTVLTATGGVSYAWSTGTTSTSVAVFPNMTTSYTVTAYSSFGCSATETAVVAVNVLPSIFFNGNTSICQGQSTTITASGGNSYMWSTGANTNAVTISTPGVYRVSVTNSLNCSRSDSITVTMWENPTVSIEGASLICSGTATQLTASGASDYHWSTNENGSAVTVMPSQTTTYTVTGTDVHGCSATTSKVVNVEALPDVHISGILAICHGNTTTLTATPANEYLWSTGATTQSITVGAQGSYSVMASSVNGCQSTASVTVVDNPMPVFTVTGESFFCANSSATLTIIGDDSYVWDTGDTTKQIVVTQGGAYTVTATNVYGCSQSSTAVVTQMPVPVLFVQGPSSLCQGDTTILYASSDAMQFLWNTGETTPYLQVIPDNTLYSVTATGANGCTSTAEHMVTSLPTYTNEVSGTVCQGQAYSGYGFEIPAIDSAGTFSFTRNLQSVWGCDSTIHLTLTVKSLPVLDSIVGWPNIVQYGNSIFFVNEENCVDIEHYEWRVSNTHWTLLNESTPRVTVIVNTNGTGVLTLRGINGCGYTEQSIGLYCNVGIEDHPLQAEVKLYPNPVHQSLYINLEEASEVNKVSLFDETGRLVYQTDCNDTHLEIDCTRFANGHYTVLFFDEKGRRVESRKIIVKNK
jgi:hypothetical protein